MVSQEFNPVNFLKKKTTKYSVSQRYMTGIINDRSKGLQVYV